MYEKLKRKTITQSHKYLKCDDLLHFPNFDEKCDDHRNLDDEIRVVVKHVEYDDKRLDDVEEDITD